MKKKPTMLLQMLGMFIFQGFQSFLFQRMMGTQGFPGLLVLFQSF